MEQLIEFLVKHWYLVLIGLTFWYQLQNKARRAANRKPSPRGGMPAFGGSPDQDRRPPSPGRQEVEAAARDTRSKGVQGDYTRSGAPVAPDAPKPKGSPFSKPAASLHDASPVYAGDLTGPGAFPESPSREQLLQGVVWAEILGPPRSKKPYRK
ncbi:hypothetical protein ACFPES_16660 [Paenibacillus sp. GCM10023248]|uniref:hypothetical protein n=1 Tax=unclassified Paenibacillus TaxID=185978 RepID=UPI002379FD94|nr:hypothetical protein [Paenibacillus sp. MAHUQ-63]MDD9268672.1 hypothetical protein [Paenibacillus sp. MAHUQ-63]